LPGCLSSITKKNSLFVFPSFSPRSLLPFILFSSSLNSTAAAGAPTARVGTEFCTHPFVRKISFTGSTKVGKLLMKQSSDTVKRTSLELGGNAPFVVFDDVADLDQAVDAAMVSKFRNAGQTCVCADRFLVQAGIHDEFVARLVAKVESELRVGPGIDPKTTMGPLITANAVESVTQKVNEAIEEGAKCWTGNGGTSATDGDPASSPLGPHFMAPIVLTGVDRESAIWKTETFGPVAPIMSFDTEEEALEIANDSSVGLASYFCTSDLSRAFRFAQK
jgi:succinate-semialdehyde dehydrogenase/glutarate-semialdehyde dehydrogenase